MMNSVPCRTCNFQPPLPLLPLCLLFLSLLLRRIAAAKGERPFSAKLLPQSRMNKGFHQRWSCILTQSAVRVCCSHVIVSLVPRRAGWFARTRPARTGPDVCPSPSLATDPSAPPAPEPPSDLRSVTHTHTHTGLNAQTLILREFKAHSANLTYFCPAGGAVEPKYFSLCAVHSLMLPFTIYVPVCLRVCV